MRWHIYKSRHEPGFRMNVVDIAMLASVSLLSWYASQPFADHYLYLIPLYVGLSFFFFCNIVRIGNRVEPFWYIPFVLLTLYGLTRPEIYWLLVLGICEPIRAALVIYRIRQGNYKGAFYRSFNKAEGLDE